MSLWGRLGGRPGGRLLFSLAFGWMVPYSGTIRARIRRLQPGDAVVELLDRRRVRNHLGSIHAIALANLGEMATGLALNTALPPDARAILVSLDVRYVKKARGRLTALCRCPTPQVDDDRDVEVACEIRDPSEEVVTTVRATWRVGPRR